MNIDELKTTIKRSRFNNPTKGFLRFKEVVKELANYQQEKPESRYKVFIGTDSETREKGVDLVSVIVIHRVGSGGRYFWLRSCDKSNLDLRSRIYKEATMSLALAQALLEQELENNHIPIVVGQSIKEAVENLVIVSNDLEIHVDIGNNGPTRVMIREITGMIRGSGFKVRIKPSACAAANVADKHL